MATEPTTGAGARPAPSRSLALRIGASVNQAFDEKPGTPPPAPPPVPQGRPPAAAEGDTSRYLNRHLSWLEFNARVLSIAEDSSYPLLERVKFLAIFSQNLDEFFQVRVAELDEQVSAGVTKPGADGMSPSEQLQAVRERTRELMVRQERVFLDHVAPALHEVGISFAEWESLTEEDRGYLSDAFDEWIFPVLTPLSVDPAHPFPYISSLSLNLAVVVRDPVTRVTRFARVKVPPLLPRFIVLPDGKRFVPLEQVIAAHLNSLFPGMEVVARHAFRVTRNADPEFVEDEAQDLRTAMATVLQRRRRSRHAVRLEVERSMFDEMQEQLVRQLELEPTDVYVLEGPLDLGGLWALYDLDRPELKAEPWKPVTQPRLAGSGAQAPDLFAVLRERDVLVHHPYDSFATSVEAFIDQAASDADVLAIKQTLYRTSGPESAIVRALIRAAEVGKQVVALVELKARFDEEANIAWAGVLEEAGVHVVYGVVGLKTHAKISLVVRREREGIRRYCHVGTGNYNPDTAKLYEDVGLMSADSELGADLTDLFNYLTGYSRKRKYRRLLVAPLTLRTRLLELIREESARPDARIVIKVNNLVDPEVIDALYEASRAGAQVDLIVRSICSLRPGVPGLSERIRVRSIVGRFLEHSRIFKFGGGDGAARYFIGSADLMARNLDRRVEAMAPVIDRSLRRRLDEVLDANLADDGSAWELLPDGNWRKAGVRQGESPQARLREIAVARAGLEPAAERA